MVALASRLTGTLLVHLYFPKKHKLHATRTYMGYANAFHNSATVRLSKSVELSVCMAFSLPLLNQAAYSGSHTGEPASRLQ